MHKRLDDFHKTFTKLKSVNAQIEANKDLKTKDLDNARDILNELYYIYKEKWEEIKDDLNNKDRNKFDYTKLRLSDDYEYECEEVEKKLIKKNHLKPIENSAKELTKLVNKEEKSMTRDLFQKFISKFISYKDKRKNKELEDLKMKLSENEIEIAETDKIVDTVRKILEFNRQNQEGQGLKILTPQQTLSRLPISLAQLKAGKNAQKLKNEIRQLLYSLYRSKKLSKTIYNI